MANVELDRLKRISPFRKVAIGTWQTAYDPSIYGGMRFRMDKAVDFIRAYRKERETPIILLTAHAMTGHREQYLAMGFDEYVTKPIVDEQILFDAIPAQDKGRRRADANPG